MSLSRAGAELATNVLTAKKYKLCLNSLGSSNHNMPQCFSKRINKCGLQHNYLLCWKKSTPTIYKEQINKKEVGVLSNKTKM